MIGRGPWSDDGQLHGCPVPGCPEKIHRFMCRGHWNATAKTARDQLWRSWDCGRGHISPELAVLAIASASSLSLAGI
jgi:hypothetical protein